MPVCRFLVAIVWLSACLPGAELHTLHGKTIKGDLLNVSAKEVVYKTPAGDVTLPTAEVLNIEFQPSALPSGMVKYSDIELTDGSLLHAARIMFSAKDQMLEVTLVGADQPCRVPLRAVAYLLNGAHEASVRQEWLGTVLAKRGNQDVVAVKVADVVNALDGTLGAITARGDITFEYDSRGTRRKRDLDPNQVYGLAFQRGLDAAAPAPLCKIVDVNQNLLVASRIEMSADRFLLTLVSGIKTEVPKALVARLDFSNDKIAYLSDLKPMETIERSRQGRKDHFRLDKNLENGPLQLKGEVFGKGLALHSHTELVYALEGKYRKFEAILGMDDQVGGDGKPVVKIEGDGRELFNKAVQRKDERIVLDLDVRGIRQLRIIVASAGLFDFGDHVDIANAKLSK